ncbi:MAG: membrane protein insertase YidC [Thermoleophilia bacterium]|nr:membrane protein insertase YidC [Thermoleophilia bacterium]
MRDYLSFLIDPLRALLEAIHGVLPVWMQPWGWAISIIVLTILVRVILIPLTVKQYTSMRSLQKLQPKMKELQARYKDDRQKLNEEMMKFYREHKVNPFGSCLPLLLQMPIFMAIYFMLISEPFATDKSFLWISDINEKDYFIVLLYMGSQLLASKLLTATVDRTQQMMMYMLPLVFGFIFLIYPFPAGVLIYWVTTNIWTIGQQLVVMRIIDAREAHAQAALATEGPPPEMIEKREVSKGGGKRAGKSGSKKKKRR